MRATEEDLRYWSDLVAEVVRTCEPDRLSRVLRVILASSAAGLTVTEGEQQAAEAVYRLADSMAAAGG
jgi:hypothetical protein